VAKEYDYSLLKSCGKDVFISANVEIKNPHLISIGNHVAIDSFCYITTAMEIGDYVHIATHCSIVGGKDALCIMEDFSGLAAACRLICASDDYLGSGLNNPVVPMKYHAKIINKPIILKKHVILGTNCVVHPGVTIEEGSVVGSCSLITKNLDEWKVYIGIPVKPIKERNRNNIMKLRKRILSENK
jgi:dTDP-4-amino-4,6-dideoxy-D-glucose acyltransferase